MNTKEIREPKQQRSIEKKNKILNAAFELLCEKGYHGTNTAEIAKRAEVSTGIIYNYFKDKKDITLTILSNYSDNLFENIYLKLNNIDPYMDDFEKIINELIDACIETHSLGRCAHEEIMALSHTDPDIYEFFHNLEEEITDKVIAIISKAGFKPENPYEKMHIAFNLVESLCHETEYHKHIKLNYSIMKKETVKIICNLLK